LKICQIRQVTVAILC